MEEYIQTTTSVGREQDATLGMMRSKNLRDRGTTQCTSRTNAYEAQTLRDFFFPGEVSSFVNRTLLTWRPHGPAKTGVTQVYELSDRIQESQRLGKKSTFCPAPSKYIDNHNLEFGKFCYYYISFYSLLSPLLLRISWHQSPSVGNWVIKNSTSITHLHRALTR